MDFQRECQKLRKICREMRRPLSSVLPNLDLDEARIRAMRRQRAKSTEPPRMVSSYDHGSLRRFRIPAIDKIRNLLQADYKKKFTRDTDKEARHQVRGELTCVIVYTVHIYTEMSDIFLYLCM